MLGDLIDLVGHAEHRFAGLANFTRLLLGGRLQAGRHRLGPRRRIIDQACCGIDARHQITQFLDGVIHRISDRACDVLGDGGLHSQVAISHFLQLIHQSQDRTLVLVIGALGFTLHAFGLHPLCLSLTGLALNILVIHKRHAKGRDRREHHARHDAHAQQGRTGLLLEHIGLQLAQRPAQGLTVDTNALLGLAGSLQRRQRLDET